jgi:hypothetical protein
LRQVLAPPVEVLCAPDFSDIKFLSPSSSQFSRARNTRRDRCSCPKEEREQALAIEEAAKAPDELIDRDFDHGRGKYQAGTSDGG